MSYGVDPLPPEEKAEKVEAVLQISGMHRNAVERFTEHEYRAVAGKLDGRIYPYRLFSPKEAAL